MAIPFLVGYSGVRYANRECDGGNRELDKKETMFTDKTKSHFFVCDDYLYVDKPISVSIWPDEADHATHKTGGCTGNVGREVTRSNTNNTESRSRDVCRHPSPLCSENVQR